MGEEEWAAPRRKPSEEHHHARDVVCGAAGQCTVHDDLGAARSRGAEDGAGATNVLSHLHRGHDGQAKDSRADPWGGGACVLLLLLGF